MKKKNLSFMTLFMLTATLVGGCSCSNQNNENVSNLVIKVGDKEYSAKELYNQLLSTGVGANEAFSKVLRIVVEQSMETSSNIQAAADLAEESFEEEVENNALTNGISKEEAREQLLKDKGYESIDQMKADIIYEEKLTRIKETYWEENKENYYNDYIEARLPYLVRHILVKIDDTNANKIANNVSISSTDGKKIYDIVKDLEKEGDFDTVARFESEDTGSNITGGAYYMDNTYGVNGFVDEFVYGTYAFDTYTTKTVNEGKTTYTFGANEQKLKKLTGLNDTETFAKYYENGFNFVDMSVINMMGEVYNQTTLSNKDYFTIGVVEKDLDEHGNVQYDEKGNIKYKDADGNLNSTENYYARSILFNRVFNKPGVSVIGYNTKEEAEATAKHYVEYKVDNETKYILADENDNAIFFVAARGSNNDIWLHFLTINVSALDDLENAKKFFSLNPSSEDNYVSYVELMSKKESVQETNSYIKELEGYVKSYATGGNGGTVGEESLLNYDMVEYYMNTKKIDYINQELKTAVQSYITNRRNFVKTKLLNSMVDDWDTHTNKLASNMSEFVQNGIKPFECAVLVEDDIDIRKNPYTALSTSDYLCRYVYEEGYEVQLSYYYETSSSSSSESFTKVSTTKTNRLYFDDNSGYTQYVKIGPGPKENNYKNIIKLPTPQVADGYEFQGWYYTKDTEGENAIKVPTQGEGENAYQYIDLSESRMTNKTIFFAKVVEKEVTTINYNYVYEGTSVNLSNDVVVNNTNIANQKYNASGNNVITLDKEKVESKYVETVKFLDKNGNEVNSITLTEADKGKTINVTVVVKPIKTTLEFKYVLADGTSVDPENPENTNSTEYTYNPNGNNEITVSKDLFDSTDYKATGAIKVARDGEEFAEAEDTSLTLSDTDMNETITVYVVVEAKGVSA